MIFSSWRKLLNRIFRIGRRLPPARPLPWRPRLESLEDRWVPSITATGQSVSFIEGVANPVVVATFIDTTPSSPGSYNTTILWGDATSSAGTVTSFGPPGGNEFAVSGTHTYAEETPPGSPHAITVLIQETTGDLDTGTADSTGTVDDAPLTPLPQTFTPTEGQAFAGTVAAFTDHNPGGTADDFTARIDWGDGTPTSTGTVGFEGMHNGLPEFTVTGTHTYSDDGVFSPSIAVQDVGGQTTVVNSTADVAESDLTLTSVGSVSFTEGQSSTVTVAHFTDNDNPDSTGAYTATIDWGDGVTDTGTVSGTSGNFTVSGTHTYADEGTFHPTVTVSETGVANSTQQVTDTANVAEADTLAVTATPVSTTEGQSFNGQVATFSDSTYPGNTSADFTATIDWGDGTTDTGTVTGSGGNFAVSGSHTYLDEDTFNVTVTVTDDGPGTASASSVGSAAVAEGDSLSPAATQPLITPGENTSFSGNVATFSDSTYPGNTSADFTASIDWGDGTTDTGTVSGSNGSFTVSGDHTYTEDGTYTVTVTLTDDDPGTASATATNTAQVAESDLTVTGTTLPSVVEGPADPVVATFSDPGSPDTTADFTASIDWGDGTTDTGIVSGSSGNFTVSGDHTYLDEGDFTITVTVVENGISNGTASATSTVTVAEADTIGASEFQPTISAAEGQSFSGEVATFGDFGYPSNSPSDFTATIDWGDGTPLDTTTGTVSSDGEGTFFVSGSHTYADEGNFTVTTTLSDNAPGTSFDVATTSAGVTESDTLTAGTTPTPSVAEGDGLTSVVVATFTDSGYPGNSPGDFSATIDWGDGTTTGGTVTGGGGTFSVSGSHAYADEGSFTVTVAITDVDDDESGSATAFATASGSVLVTEGDVLSATATPVSASEGVPFSNVPVATFTTTFAGNVAGDFTAQILWGDNTVSDGTVSGPTGGPFTVTGNHTYLDEGSFAPTVFIFDDAPGTATGSATGTATVAESDTLAATAFPQNGTEGAAISGTIATFTDTTFASNQDRDFIATIDWGDGTTSTGTVLSTGGGNFSVTDTHVYADEGNFTITVVINDDAPGTASATATATATISESDSVSPISQTITPTEGQQFSGVVAAFTDTAYPGQVAGDFTASIDWGDGTPLDTTATVSGPTGGPFSISGTHTYADEGSFCVRAFISDDSPSTLTNIAIDSTANVSEGDALIGQGQTVTPTEGQQFNGNLATFLDVNLANTPGDFTVTIDWGDGTPLDTTTGTVSGGSGSLTVSGSHSYADEGSFPITVTLTDDDPGTASATATGTANVGEGDVLTGFTGGSASAVENSAGSYQFGFLDSNPFNTTADFTATIDWGDGTPLETVSGSSISAGEGTFTVSGTHTYADEGVFTATATLIDDAPGTASASSSAPVTVTEADTLTGSGLTVAPTEGKSFSGAVATFTDNGYPGNTPADFTATIDWGDGVTDTGTVSGTGGHFTVSGSHTYADEDSFPITVTLTDDDPGTASATATSTANVGDNDPLLGAGQPVAATEGQQFNGTVANFLDLNQANTSGDFSATIDWGDGVTDTGTVSGSNGLFTVSGSHTFAEEGVFTITVTLTDDSPGTASATATIGEGDALTGTGLTVAPTEGASFSGAVATFSDGGYPGNTPADFTASIAWGDGTSTTGAVSGSPGDFTVSGDHTYADEGSFTVTVTLTDDSPGTASATASGTANVAEGDLVTPLPQTITSREGQQFSGVVAMFTDTSNPGQVAGDWTARIDWGDGATTTGTVTGATGGPFSISGTHTYADEGTFTIRAFVSDDPPSTLTNNEIDGTANVGEADGLAGLGTVLAPTEGQTFSGTVASFLDPGYPANTAGDFTATIDWGDGTTTTTGTASGGNGVFVVSGSHSYKDEGSYTVTVTLADDAPGTASATATSTANVREGDVLTPVTGGSATQPENATGTITFQFHDSNAGNTAGDFTASIDWGDGSSSTGSVSGGEGVLTVSGSHSYADEGDFTATATLTDNAPGSASATATAVVTVTESDTPAGKGITISPPEGQSFSGTVATFTDTGYPGNTAADFGASIDWGDGATTAGLVSGSAGTFTVSGTHTYADEGSFTVTVILTDDAPGTASATATSTANVGEGDTLTGLGTTISLPEGRPFNGLVATFSDGSAANTAGDFTASIDWGDGTTDTGTVSGSGGIFLVGGGHAYADEGFFTVTVTLTDDSPGTASATATTAATIAEADTLQAVPQQLTATEGQQFSGTVATFVDNGYPANTAADFTATVDWGDGSTDTGTVSGSAGLFSVGGSHTYADEGHFAVQVTLIDDDPGTAAATATSGAIVVEGDVLTAQPTTLAGTEGQAFSGAVATFGNSNTTNTADDFTATVDWGDGSTDTGTVSGSNGSFTVSGGHTYADEGSFTVTVTLTDDSPGTASATATNTATIAEADALQSTPVNLSLTEGHQFTGTVATFANTGYPGNPVVDFTATIDWGDGTTDTGTVSGLAGTFTVSGTHTYADEGNFTVTTTLSDDDAGTTSATAAGTASVAEGDTLTGLGTTISLPEGRQFNGLVATFSDSSTANTAGDFTASIVWGDGTTDTGTVSGSGGTFLVSGSHSYADEGNFTVTVTLTDDSPGTASATATTVATSTENDVLTGTGLTVTPTEAQQFSGAVATFSDSYLGNTTADFTATIDWGDGTSSAGTVSGTAGAFTVSGTHTYADEGHFSVKVTLTDDSPGTVSAGATGTANVGEADVLTGTGATLTPTEGTSFSGSVATFTNTGYPANTSADFTATIDWGDGTTTPGTVTGSSGEGAGQFTVSGSHTYTDEGSFTVKVTLTDDAPGTASATATGTANVSGGSFGNLTAAPVNGFELTPLTGVTVASFTHSNGLEPASGFSASIDWGDGTSSAGTVTQPTPGGPYTVQGSHTYGDEHDNATLTVTVTDGSATATATSTASILEELLPDGTRGSPNQRFISEVYRDMLGRKVDPLGLLDWANTLTTLEATGVSASDAQTQVVGFIQNAGTEYRMVVVQGYYQQFLHRAADPNTEAPMWINFLQQGGSQELMVASMVSGPEYFQLRGGGTNDGWLTAFYQDAFHRPITDSERMLLDGFFAKGTTLFQVASSLVASNDWQFNVIQGYYQRYMDRTANMLEVGGWTGQLRAGFSDDQVLAMFLGSPDQEFFRKVQA
jgi:hypothetical protein